MDIRTRSPSTSLNLTDRAFSRLPDHVADFLEIATYVYCADQLVPRDGPQMHNRGGDWRRSFTFHIGVRDAPFWSRPEISELLVSTIRTLSADVSSFAFAPAQYGPTQRNLWEFSGQEPPPSFSPDHIVMFSGGLDSCAGAVECLSRGKRIALVSHQASPFIISKQSKLIAHLNQRFQRNALFQQGIHVTLGGNRACEFTQRTRSLLFASIGMAIAELHRKSELTFFENGVVSLNLPLASHVVGTRATRTTHPAVLHAFSQLLTLIAGRDFRVVNPHFWKTKTDVIKLISDLGHGDLLSQTFSCSHVREAQKDGLHCGACSQCMDRRLAMLAAGCGRFEPSGNYRIDPIAGARSPGPGTVVAQAYAITAVQYSRMSPAWFMGRHGEMYRALTYLDMPAARAIQQIYELHVRHGKQITAAINKCLASTMTVEARQELPDSSLLATLMAPGGLPAPVTDPSEHEAPPSVQAANSPHLLIHRPIVFAINTATRHIHFQNGVALDGAPFRLFRELYKSYAEDRLARLNPDEFRFATADELATRLQVSAQTVRQCVTRLRNSLGTQFADRGMGTLDADDVVENSKWKGYRLNPHLASAPDLLGASPPSGVTTSSTNVTTRQNPSMSSMT